MICRGARAQVFKTEVNDILRHAPFSFTSRLSVIKISHAKQASGGSQAIKSKGFDSIGSFCLIIRAINTFCILQFGTGHPYYRPFSRAMASE